MPTGTANLNVLHPVKPRVQEICEFARKMGYRKLGIAFCAGLPGEGQALMRILMAQDFETASTNRLCPFSLSLEGGAEPPLTGYTPSFSRFSCNSP